MLETGEVWHARQDFRQAESAAEQLERDYGLSEAPRQRASTRTRTPAVVEREGYRGKQAVLGKQRAEELAAGRAVLARSRAGIPDAGVPVRPKSEQETTSPEANAGQRLSATPALSLAKLNLSAVRCDAPCT